MWIYKHFENTCFQMLKHFSIDQEKVFNLMPQNFGSFILEKTCNPVQQIVYLTNFFRPQNTANYDAVKCFKISFLLDCLPWSIFIGSRKDNSSPHVRIQFCSFHNEDEIMFLLWINEYDLHYNLPMFLRQMCGKNYARFPFAFTSVALSVKSIEENEILAGVWGDVLWRVDFNASLLKSHEIFRDFHQWAQSEAWNMIPFKFYLFRTCFFLPYFVNNLIRHFSFDESVWWEGSKEKVDGFIAFVKVCLSECSDES